MPLAPPPDVRAWIDRQDEDERAVLARTWAIASLAPSAPPPDADAAWDRLGAALDAADREPVSPSTRAADRAPASRTARRWLAGALVASAVALAVVVGGEVVVDTDGEVTRLALPDGSAVALAPGSEIRYRRGFWAGDRAVALSGQGFFEVEPDGRPFRVETANATVEVLGTAFDVRAWPGESAETAVAVVHGSVRFGAHGRSVVLAAGESSRAGAGAPTDPSRADLEAVAAWQTGGFSVADAPLGAVVAAVEGRFGRPVRLGPGVDPDRRLTLFLPHAETAEAVLGDVAAYLDLRLQAAPGRYDLLAR